MINGLKLNKNIFTFCILINIVLQYCLVTELDLSILNNKLNEFNSKNIINNTLQDHKENEDIDITLKNLINYNIIEEIPIKYTKDYMDVNLNKTLFNSKNINYDIKKNQQYAYNNNYTIRNYSHFNSKISKISCVHNNEVNNTSSLFHSNMSFIDKFLKKFDTKIIKRILATYNKTLEYIPAKCSISKKYDLINKLEFIVANKTSFNLNNITNIINYENFFLNTNSYSIYYGKWISKDNKYIPILNSTSGTIAFTINPTKFLLPKNFNYFNETNNDKDSYINTDNINSEYLFSSYANYLSLYAVIIDDKNKHDTWLQFKSNKKSKNNFCISHNTKYLINNKLSDNTSIETNGLGLNMDAVLTNIDVLKKIQDYGKFSYIYLYIENNYIIKKLM